MASFEKKILQSILGGVNENNSWSRRYNFELYSTYKQPNIKYIKINRMNWTAHIIRMLDDNVVKKILQFKVTGIRKRGRPGLRWADSVESDFGIVNEKAWRTKVDKGSLWRNLQRKA
ncbi:uncharacterized transposon-derived protein F52C9.6 [Trichonephila clavipes]|nr:uncharacterized transposon-derived protein F52C9.6 [Trichonephila clavipes]